jgi:hypothetical protein
MKSRLVSIIIPTYNRAHLVVEAIRSAANQSYREKQIIVIDDGSEDNTTQIVAQFEDVEYYRQENKGQAAARNLGLSYAKGEYIASLDSDDVWEDDFLTHGVECLEKHDLDFVFLNWTGTDGKENCMNAWERENKWEKLELKHDADWRFLESEQLRRVFLVGCPAPSSSVVFRRSSLASSWNEQMLMADDWLLILEMIVSKPCRAAFTLKPHWLKRVLGDNIYDGRDILEITVNALSDEKLMAKRLNPKLTSAEKAILRKRLGCYYLNCERLKLKFEGFSKGTVFGIAHAFAVTPVGISFYVMEMIINSIKLHIKTLLSNE